MNWPTHPLTPIDINAGPCAWTLSLAIDHPDYLAKHPSPIVITPDAGDDLLSAAREPLADALQHLPIILGVRAPAFARRLAELVKQRLAALGRERTEVLILWPDDPEDLKSGNLVQSLMSLRDAGVIGQFGFGDADVRHAEWIIQNAGGRAIVTTHSLADQSARYRTLPLAAEFGYTALTTPLDPAALSHDATRFALAIHEHILPVFTAPLPEHVTPMTSDQAAAAWEQYQQTDAEPEPLPRSKPPTSE